MAGNFSNPGAGFALDGGISFSANVDAIKASNGWKQFSHDTVTDAPNSGSSSTLSTFLTGGVPRIGGSVTDNNFGATQADFFNGKALYLWVFNGTTIANSSEMGIFRATTTTVPWTFPTNAGGIGDSSTLSTTSSTSPTITASIGSTPPGQLQLASVPDPSTALLIATGFAGLALRRRRKAA